MIANIDSPTKLAHPDHSVGYGIPKVLKAIATDAIPKTRDIPKVMLAARRPSRTTPLYSNHDVATTALVAMAIILLALFATIVYQLTMKKTATKTR